MWNFIPQVFYDFLARVVPGATVIVASACVFFGTGSIATRIFTPLEGSQLFTFGSLILWALTSYITGFVLGELWEVGIGRLERMTEQKIEDDCKQGCLTEHQRLRHALGVDPLPISAHDLPRNFVMREHLRHVAPADAARLLKVRAERRLCQVLILGLGGLAVFNVYFICTRFSWGTVWLEILLIFTVFSCATRNRRLFRHFVNGTCVAWLAQALPSMDKERQVDSQRAEAHTVTGQNQNT